LKGLNTHLRVGAPPGITSSYKSYEIHCIVGPVYPTSKEACVILIRVPSYGQYIFRKYGQIFNFCQNWRIFSKKLGGKKTEYFQLIMFNYPRCENWPKKITPVMRLNFLAICSKTNLECKNHGNMSF